MGAVELTSPRNKEHQHTRTGDAFLGGRLDIQMHPKAVTPPLTFTHEQETRAKRKHQQREQEGIHVVNVEMVETDRRERSKGAPDGGVDSGLPEGR